MGAGASAHTDETGAKIQLEQKSIGEICSVMYPVYYTEDNVTNQDYVLGQATWNMVLNDASPVYIEMRKDPNCQYSSCIMFFYEIFYARLFDIHPLCKPLFKSGMKAQGKALVKIVSLSLTCMEDPTKFDQIMIKLAETHNQKGVKAVEYGIVGETIFWTLNFCLGKEVFNFHAKMAWIRIFSRMLRVVIPVAVAFELDNGSAQLNRLKEQLKKETENHLISLSNSSAFSASRSGASTQDS